MEDESWVVWLTLVFLLVSTDASALRTSSSEGQMTQLRLMTKTAESEILSRKGPTIRENEIAAIFRGVAYGAPTQGRPNATASSRETVELSTTSSQPFSVTPPSEKQDSLQYYYTSAVPKSFDNYHSNHKQSKASNHSSLVANDVREIIRADIDGKRTDEKQWSTANDILVLSTSFPLATSHTTSGVDASDGKADGNNANGSKSKGVWISGFPNSIKVRWSLGVAWWVHVYVSVGLFTLLALVSLCLMARVAITTHLLPRPHYLALHIMVFCASFVRSLHILHESHDMKTLLPASLKMAVEEYGWPCLTAALSVLLGMVLKEWRYPKHPHLALMLYLFTLLHLIALPSAHISMVWLKPENIPLRVIIRAVSTGWGGVIGVGGMWSVWNESRDLSSHLTDVQVSHNQRNYPNLTHPARLVLTAALTQLLLAGIHLYTLLVPLSPESHTWVWWSCVTVSRGLELIVGSTLLTAAALTLARQSPCHVFGTCCQKRTVEIVHPAEIKMIHPMGVYTLQPARPKNEHAQTIAALSLSNSYKEKRDHSSLDYVTSDFQLVWNHSRQRPIGASQMKQQIIDDSVLQVCNDKGFDDLPTAHILPHKPRGIAEPFLSSNAFSSTLPRNRMYAAPHSCLPLQDDLKTSQDGGLNYASKSSTLLSGSSGSSKLYSSPQVPLKSSRSWDEISTGHIYEDLMKHRPGSVDEGLSDFSDMNSDNTNDLFYSETGSPVLIRPARTQQRRSYAACYIRANYFKPHAIPPPPPSGPSPQQNELNIRPQTSANQAANNISAAQQSLTQPSSTHVTTHTSTHPSITHPLNTHPSSSHPSSTQKLLSEYCPDSIPTSPLVPDLLSAQISSTQQGAIQFPSTRSAPINPTQSGAVKSKAK